VVPKVVGSNPIFHPKRKSLSATAEGLCFFIALKACFQKHDEKTKTLMSAANERLFLFGDLLRGSPFEQSENGNPSACAGTAFSFW
jgi:hypothetical protein